MNKSTIELYKDTTRAEYSIPQIFYNIYLTYIPICVIVGLFGNAMVWILIKSNRILWKLPTNVYLLALALVSSLFLVLLMIFWIEDAFNINVFKNTTFSCKVNTFLAHVCDFVSVWLIVLVGSERLILLHWKTRSLTKERARSQILFLLAAAVVFNAWIIAVADIIPETEICDIDDNYSNIYNFMTIMEMIFCIGVPSLIILVSNCIVVVKLHRHIKKYPSSPSVSFTSEVVMNSNTAASNTKMLSIESQPIVKQSIKKGLRYTDIQLTRSLLVVTWLFIVLNIPSYVYRIVSNSFGFRQEDVVIKSMGLIVHMLLYSHHAFVFYFYIFYSPQMKRRLKPTAMKLLECYCFKPPGDFSTET